MPAVARMSTARVRNQAGLALIGVIVLSALLMALAVALGLAVRSDTQMRGALAATVTGFYAAESGLNQGMGEYRNIFMSYNVPGSSDFTERTLTLGDRLVKYKMTPRAGNPQNIVIPSGELFAGLNAQQYRYTVNSTSHNLRNEVEAAVGAEFLVGYIPLFQFVAFYRNDLEIAPGPQMNLEGRVHSNSNLYLNADSGPLNIRDNPGVGVFTVQVTAGGDIYRGRKRSANECTGTVAVDKLEDKSPKDNNLDPKNLDCGSGSSATRKIPTSELAQWKGSMFSQLGSIAIPEPDIIRPPLSVSNGGHATPGVYWEHADLRIVLHLNRPGSLSAAGPFLPHSIEVVGASGATDVARTTALQNFMRAFTWNWNNSAYPGTMPIFYTDVPFSGTSTCAHGDDTCNNTNPTSYTPRIPGPKPDGTAVINARDTGANNLVYGARMGWTGANAFDLDYRRGGFYNQREEMWMLLLNINVTDLIRWNGQNGEPFFANNDSSEGGLVIFATIDGPDSNTDNNYGVRVFGSANIPLAGGIGVSADPTGVTVVSDQAMYVLGNFNQGLVNGGTARQPASLIGDSINVLSQNWWNAGCIGGQCRDGQSVAGLTAGPRDAQNTWINAAFLGGVDDTPLNGGSGNYNGGLENYPRFHEDWAGIDLNYQGSFVSLGTPAHVDGLWRGTGGAINIYNPPDRNWNFDPAFNDAANLPPLTPRFVYVQQVLFTEDFK